MEKPDSSWASVTTELAMLMVESIVVWAVLKLVEEWGGTLVLECYGESRLPWSSKVCNALCSTEPGPSANFFTRLSNGFKSHLRTASSQGMISECKQLKIQARVPGMYSSFLLYKYLSLGTFNAQWHLTTSVLLLSSGVPTLDSRAICNNTEYAAWALVSAKQSHSPMHTIKQFVSKSVIQVSMLYG